MKRSRSSYEALSPRPSDYHAQQHQTIKQHCDANSPGNFYTDLFGDELISAGNLDPLQQYLNYHDSHQEQANTLNQPGHSNTGIDTQRSRLQTQQAFERIQQSIPQHDNGVLPGATNYAEHPGSISVSRETTGTQHNVPTNTAASPYNARYRSCSITMQRSTVIPMPKQPADPACLSEVRSTSYGPYCSLFLDSNVARDHRHLITRFGRQPYIPPEDDPTIHEVEENRPYQVARIYDAMTRGDRAQDNTNSIAMKRWVDGAHYKSDLVEAFAHKVFDCLLMQVKEGFRGWHHNDYVDDDRKGEKEDREADCMSRLENIIDALEREKTICEDVVNSASQIRMFVNAPIAYAARKYQNRVGNSKRGRVKDAADPNPRPKNAWRTGARHTRTRSATTSEVPTSRDSTPQFQTPATTIRPYYTTQSSQQSASSPMPTYSSPRQPLYKSVASMPQVHVGHQQAAVTSSPMMAHSAVSSSAISRPAMSPPMLPTSRLHNTHITTKPPTPRSPLASTPSLSYSYHSAPPSPDDAKYPTPPTPLPPWANPCSLEPPPCTAVDPVLRANDLLFRDPIWPEPTTAVNANGIITSLAQNPDMHHISLSEIEHRPFQPATRNQHAAFESYWNDQPGVQHFSFDGREEDRTHR